MACATIQRGTWFGTRGSQVRILSPRPSKLARLRRNCGGRKSLRSRTPEFGPPVDHLRSLSRGFRDSAPSGGCGDATRRIDGTRGPWVCECALPEDVCRPLKCSIFRTQPGGCGSTLPPDVLSAPSRHSCLLTLAKGVYGCRLTLHTVRVPVAAEPCQGRVTRGRGACAPGADSLPDHGTLARHARDGAPAAAVWPCCRAAPVR